MSYYRLNPYQSPNASNNALPPYLTRTGRDVFNEESICLLNRWPVRRLRALILSGFKAVRTSKVEGEKAVRVKTGELPFSQYECTERLITDGPFVVINPRGSTLPPVDPQFLNDLLDVTRTSFKQQLRAADGKIDPARMVTYELAGQEWTVTEWAQWGSDKPQAVGSSAVPLAQIYVYPNEFPNEYFAQHGYNRLEEIKRDIRRRLKGASSKSVVSGIDGNTAQIINQFEDENATTVIVNDGAVVSPPATSIIDQHLRDYDSERAEYLAAMCVVDDEGANRPVAGDRMLRMEAQTNEVDYQRDKLTEIYEHFGLTLTFRRIITMTAAERTIEADLYDRYRLMLGEDRYNELVLSLMP